MDHSGPSSSHPPAPGETATPPVSSSQVASKDCTAAPVPAFHAHMPAPQAVAGDLDTHSSASDIQSVPAKQCDIKMQGARVSDAQSKPSFAPPDTSYVEHSQPKSKQEHQEGKPGQLKKQGEDDTASGEAPQKDPPQQQSKDQLSECEPQKQQKVQTEQPEKEASNPSGSSQARNDDTKQQKVKQEDSKRRDSKSQSPLQQQPSRAKPKAGPLKSAMKQPSQASHSTQTQHSSTSSRRRSSSPSSLVVSAAPEQPGSLYTPTPAEASALRAAFERFDSDRDGVLSLAETTSLLRALGYTYSPSFIATLFELTFERSSPSIALEGSLGRAAASTASAAGGSKTCDGLTPERFFDFSRIFLTLHRQIRKRLRSLAQSSASALTPALSPAEATRARALASSRSLLVRLAAQVTLGEGGAVGYHGAAMECAAVMKGESGDTWGDGSYGSGSKGRAPPPLPGSSGLPSGSVSPRPPGSSVNASGLLPPVSVIMPIPGSARNRQAGGSKHHKSRASDKNSTQSLTADAVIRATAVTDTDAEFVTAMYSLPQPRPLPPGALPPPAPVSATGAQSDADVAKQSVSPPTAYLSSAAARAALPDLHLMQLRLFHTQFQPSHGYALAASDFGGETEGVDSATDASSVADPTKARQTRRRHRRSLLGLTENGSRASGSGWDDEGDADDDDDVPPPISAAEAALRRDAHSLPTALSAALARLIADEASFLSRAYAHAVAALGRSRAGGLLLADIPRVFAALSLPPPDLSPQSNASGEGAAPGPVTAPSNAIAALAPYADWLADIGATLLPPADVAAAVGGAAASAPWLAGLVHASSSAAGAKAGGPLPLSVVPFPIFCELYKRGFFAAVKEHAREMDLSGVLQAQPSPSGVVGRREFAGAVRMWVAGPGSEPSTLAAASAVAAAAAATSAANAAAVAAAATSASGSSLSAIASPAATAAASASAAAAAAAVAAADAEGVVWGSIEEDLPVDEAADGAWAYAPLTPPSGTIAEDAAAAAAIESAAAAGWIAAANAIPPAPACRMRSSEIAFLLALLSAAPSTVPTPTTGAGSGLGPAAAFASAAAAVAAAAAATAADDVATSFGVTPLALARLSVTLAARPLPASAPADVHFAALLLQKLLRARLPAPGPALKVLGSLPPHARAPPLLAAVAPAATAAAAGCAGAGRGVGAGMGLDTVACLMRPPRDLSGVGWAGGLHRVLRSGAAIFSPTGAADAFSAAAAAGAEAEMAPWRALKGTSGDEPSHAAATASVYAGYWTLPETSPASDAATAIAATGMLPLSAADPAAGTIYSGIAAGTCMSAAFTPADEAPGPSRAAAAAAAETGGVVELAVLSAEGMPALPSVTSGARVRCVVLAAVPRLPAKPALAAAAAMKAVVGDNSVTTGRWSNDNADFAWVPVSIQAMIPISRTTSSVGVGGPSSPSSSLSLLSPNIGLGGMGGSWLFPSPTASAPGDREHDYSQLVFTAPPAAIAAAADPAPFTTPPGSSYATGTGSNMSGNNDVPGITSGLIAFFELTILLPRPCLAHPAPPTAPRASAVASAAGEGGFHEVSLGWAACPLLPGDLRAAGPGKARRVSMPLQTGSLLVPTPLPPASGKPVLHVSITPAARMKERQRALAMALPHGSLVPAQAVRVLRLARDAIADVLAPPTPYFGGPVTAGGGRTVSIPATAALLRGLASPDVVCALAEVWERERNGISLSQRRDPPGGGVSHATKAVFASLLTRLTPLLTISHRVAAAAGAASSVGEAQLPPLVLGVNHSLRIRILRRLLDPATAPLAVLGLAPSSCANESASPIATTPTGVIIVPEVVPSDSSSTASATNKPTSSMDADDLDAFAFGLPPAPALTRVGLLVAANRERARSSVPAASVVMSAVAKTEKLLSGAGANAGALVGEEYAMWHEPFDAADAALDMEEPSDARQRVVWWAQEQAHIAATETADF